MTNIFTKLILTLFMTFILAGCSGLTFNDLVRKGNLVKVQQKVDDKPKLAKFSDDDKVTPLHVAASWGYLEIVKYLIEKGADINAQDAWKKTPLYRAVSKENLEIVKYLIEKGADKSIKDIDGKTAVDLANYLKSSQLIELLGGSKKEEKEAK